MDKKDKQLKDIFENDPLGLLNIKPSSSPARNEDERLVASFREINEFFEKNNREPEAGGGIKEHMLYSRLKSIREDEEKMLALEKEDKYNLLKIQKKEITTFEDLMEDDSLGILDSDADSIFKFNHTPKETSMPDYIAKRSKCEDFNQFEDIFKQCQANLREGKRKLYPFKNETQIDKGYFFVLKGILLYVAEIGKKEVDDSGKSNARLRCIFENGTESDLLMRSLAAELYKDGRRVTEHEDKLLDNFKNITSEDEEAGYIYVLKSKSTQEDIRSIENLYKIGYSKDKVEDRIKNAENEPTYLMAPVSIVTAFKCYNMNPQKLEQLLHNFFGVSCLNADVFDHDGNRHTPREWFIAPLEVIEQAVYFIINGDIVNYKYDERREIIVGR